MNQMKINYKIVSGEVKQIRPNIETDITSPRMISLMVISLFLKSLTELIIANTASPNAPSKKGKMIIPIIFLFR